MHCSCFIYYQQSAIVVVHKHVSWPIRHFFRIISAIGLLCCSNVILSKSEALIVINSMCNKNRHQHKFLYVIIHPIRSSSWSKYMIFFDYILITHLSFIHSPRHPGETWQYTFIINRISSAVWLQHPLSHPCESHHMVDGSVWVQPFPTIYLAEQATARYATTWIFAHIKGSLAHSASVRRCWCVLNIYRVLHQPPINSYRTFGRVTPISQDHPLRRTLLH